MFALLLDANSYVNTINTWAEPHNANGVERGVAEQIPLLLEASFVEILEVDFFDLVPLKTTPIEGIMLRPRIELLTFVPHESSYQLTKVSNPHDPMVQYSGIVLDL